MSQLLHDFWIKVFLLFYFINWLDFSGWLCLLCEILYNMWFRTVCWSGCDIINFNINLIFLIKPLFLHDQKVKTKIQISWERKEFLRRNKKHLFSQKAFIEANKITFFRGWKPDFNKIKINKHVLSSIPQKLKKDMFYMFSHGFSFNNKNAEHFTFLLRVFKEPPSSSLLFNITERSI